MQNQELARIFYEISAHLELEGVMFKPRAYEKAARGIELLGQDVAALYEKGGLKELEEIPGVGKSIARAIEEFLKSGKVKHYESLKKKYPDIIREISRIEGVGLKGALKLHQSLKVKTIDDLANAARAGQISRINGFGEKSEKNILAGIAFARKTSGKFVLGFVLPEIREIEKRLKGLAQVEHVVIAGSARRWKETISDLDVLVVSQNPEAVMDFFVSMPEVVDIYAHGMTKSSVRLKNELTVDIRVVRPESFGAALSYFTGSKEHNIALREIAMKKGCKLNEYGLFQIKKGKEKEVLIAGATERDVYEKIGLCYIEPELRENQGEIEGALRQFQGKMPGLPKIVGYGDIRGDLHMHTDWTDGASSIKEMALEAKKLGREYIAITDHTKSLAIAGGLNEKQLLRQMAEIDHLNKVFSGKPKILKGAEVNILKNGQVDISDALLAKLDVCGAAVHSNFNISRKDMTERIRRAMSNPHVDIIFHPTGRRINRRPGYEIEMEEILGSARQTGTALEINSHPDRLDLKDEHVKRATHLGVKLVVNTDAHALPHLCYLELGIAQARRGWAGKNNILNTKSVATMLKSLKQ